MTALAAGAKLAFVLVVLFVTGNAGGFEFVLIKITLVASHALGFLMCAFQWKLCLSPVIKTDCLPFILSMAATAFEAKITLMDILNIVAGHAGGADVLVFLSPVTALAGDLDMRVLQWEFCFIMVKLFCRTPRLFAMAVSAFLTEVSEMRFNFLMT